MPSQQSSDYGENVKGQVWLPMGSIVKKVRKTKLMDKAHWEMPALAFP